MSALARREREGAVSQSGIHDAVERLRVLADSWHEVLPVQAIRRLAERLVRSHPLRAADAFQLAAAVIASDNDPYSLDLLSLDSRLLAAAGREGFRLI